VTAPSRLAIAVPGVAPRRPRRLRVGGCKSRRQLGLGVGVGIVLVDATRMARRDSPCRAEPIALRTIPRNAARPTPYSVKETLMV